MIEFFGKVEAAWLADWAVIADPHFWIMMAAIIAIMVLGVLIAWRL
jgi:hypothetical protein